MRAPVLRQPTMQVALFLGFALIVGLWGYTGYEFTIRMAGVEAESAKVTARYLEAQDRLTTIRSQILVASVQVRDALLEPNPALIDRYDQQLDATYRNIDRALRDYAPVVDTEAGRARRQRRAQRLQITPPLSALPTASLREWTWSFS